MKLEHNRICVKYAVAGLLALTVFGAARAQTPDRPITPGSTESVIVHSQRVKDWNFSAGFVRSLLRPSFMLQGQFATWKLPVCPRVKGMSAASAHLIEQRIREVAKKIGAPLDQSDTCAPNIVIIVSQEPQTILDGLKDKDRMLFASTPVGELQMHYPVQVWYYSIDRDYNGKTFTDGPIDAALSTSFWDIPQMKSNNTRLYTGIQPETRIATIIADSNAIKGVALGTFADYVTLLSLAQAPVTGQCQPAPSIANLFLSNCGGDFHTTGLSTTDLAMLTGVYQTPDSPERLQKVRIINNMRKNLEMAQQK
jgi:hypothetical protein